MATREETQVLIIGAGPSGLAVSACLSHRHIPHIILEKEDCIAPLWKKRAYARLRLHLAKEFCSLPLRPHSHTADTYMSKDDFIQYLDDYVAEFNIVIRHCRSVNSALYVKSSGKWHIEARNSDSNNMEAYSSQFFVAASGANSKGLIPDISGLMNYHGVKLHSSQYVCGLDHCRENVLVVGCGNSGMEVSLDLANHGANCSIVIRSPLYVFTREMIRAGMYLLNCIRLPIVDILMVIATYKKYGDLTKYGIHRPRSGPFTHRRITGKTPIIDIGTVDKVKQGEIKVMPEISTIRENGVIFKNNTEYMYNTIIFATGYTGTTCDWLKNYEFMLKEDGMPRRPPPFHWKGDNNIYCAGLARMGLAGLSRDAQMITDDIALLLQDEEQMHRGRVVMVMIFVFQILESSMLLLP